jgi:hypothetical protein
MLSWTAAARGAVFGELEYFPTSLYDLPVQYIGESALLFQACFKLCAMSVSKFVRGRFEVGVEAGFWPAHPGFVRVL